MTETVDEKKPSQYYYWHGHEKERAKLGDVAPKPVPVLVGSGDPEHSHVLKSVPITKYSWCNNTSSVSVYVDFEGVNNDNVRVEFFPKKLRVEVQLSESSVSNVLVLHLAKEIDAEKSSFRLKPNQIVIKAVKTDDTTWYDLTDNKAHTEDD